MFFLLKHRVKKIKIKSTSKIDKVITVRMGTDGKQLKRYGSEENNWCKTGNCQSRGIGNLNIAVKD